MTIRDPDDPYGLLDGDPDDPSDPGRIPVSLGPKNWSSVSPSLFATVREEMLKVWAEELGIDVGDLPIDRTGANRALNAYAAAFKTEHGFFPRSLVEVQDDPQSWVRLTREVTGAEGFPERFRVAKPDGSFDFYLNPPNVAFPVQTSELGFSTEVRREVSSLIPRQAGSFDPVTGRQRTLQTGGVGGSGIPEDPEKVTPPTSAERRARGSGLEPLETPSEIIDKIRNFPSSVLGTFRDLTAPNVISEDDFNRIQGRSMITTTTTTSGGGGGRTALAFDRSHLAEVARDQWRTLMLEEPRNPEGLVDEYIKEANSMWLGGGAQLDFNTWVLNKIRATGRYNTLYGRKDESQSELDYLNSFRQGTAPFGLSPRIEKQELERGLTNAPAPASFQESVAFGRDVQAIGQGTFSRRFASMIDSLGSLQRS